MSDLQDGAPIRTGPAASVTADPGFGAYLTHLYGDHAGSARSRYALLEQRLREQFHAVPEVFASAPGRVEIGGNHTDHNHGRVIAASIGLDAIAAAVRSDDGIIRIESEGYAGVVEVGCTDLEPRAEEAGTTQALVRGIAARFRAVGLRVGGFRATVSSQVAPGSGLSSSAAFEVLAGTLLSTLYNEGRVGAEDIAIIGQYAENAYFGKPCGLMDQVASAVGGIVTIDFEDPAHPVIRRLTRSFTESGIRPVVVHTGGNHADLTAEYAAVPAEMKAVARALGGDVCRDIGGEDAVVRAIPRLRGEVGDRAILRALHFLGETSRVARQVAALDDGRIGDFLAEVTASGRSSALWLQNCNVGTAPAEQGIMLALALTEGLPGVAGRGGWRVHGGGFAGTMLALLPVDLIAPFRERMEHVFGAGSVVPLTVRTTGATAFGTVS